MWYHAVVLVLLHLLTATTALNKTEAAAGAHRDKKLVSLFSVVQFPNSVCTTATSGIYGTCITASECTTRGGSKSGNCASGFGVCCLVATSTCAGTITYNNTYIQNPGFPSAYTPSSSGTCTFTVNKVSSDVCQLRFDFQTFTGFTVAASTSGACTDSFAVTGQTGKAPPTICGTNTGYHMYAEIGADTSDTSTVTITYGGTTSTQFNIFVQQIECTATYRAPTDCVQYYTGSTGTVQSFGWAGGQLLAGMDYRVCIREELNSCSISWKTTTGTTIDAFAMLTPNAAAPAATAITGACLTTDGLGVVIPELSSTGTAAIAAATTSEGFLGAHCGGIFGIATATIAGSTLVSARKPYHLHVFVKSPITLVDPSTGFSLDYSQNAC